MVLDDIYDQFLYTIGGFVTMIPIVGKTMHPSLRKLRVNAHNKSIWFCDNSVRTAKYTIISFIPKNLIEQFMRVANLYFALISFLQVFSGLSPTGRWGTVFPLVIVMTFQAAKDILEDLKRTFSDIQVNNSKAQVLRNGKLINIYWRSIRVGDIVKVNDGQYFPADLICLSSSDLQGSLYIETANLDGETNLKIKKALHETAQMRSVQDFQKFKAHITCDNPNEELYSFTGKIEIGHQEYPLSADNQLLRGAKLKNTKFIFGVVVYTGKQTKLMKNNKNPPHKTSKVERVTNYFILSLFAFIFFLGVLCSCTVFIARLLQKHWYLEAGGPPAWLEFLQGFIVYFILYNNFIPISLYVSMETVKLLQARLLIDRDVELYDEESDTPASCKASSLNEELGQVEFVFSDKTGTLTQNKMEFLKFSVDGEKYGRGSTEIGRLSAIRRGEAVLPDDESGMKKRGFRFDDERILDGAWKNQTNSNKLFDFLMLLSICHTVIPEDLDEEELKDIGNQVGPNGCSQVKYQASSPDEGALVLAAKQMGFYFYRRTHDSVTVNIEGKDYSFHILNTLEFTSTRGRMSVIVKMPPELGGEIVLYTKGSDKAISKRMAPDQKYMPETVQSLKIFAAEGLRTLLCAKVPISEQEYNDWNNNVFQPANLSLEKKEEKIAAACEEIEKNLLLVGATAIEDKLQKDVPNTIETLAKAGIRIWVLTGDKQETAINIGYACAMLDNDMKVVILNQRKKKFLRHQICDSIAQIEKSRDKLFLGGENSKKEKKFAVVIDGDSLSLVLGTKVEKKEIPKKSNSNKPPSKPIYGIPKEESGSSSDNSARPIMEEPSTMATSSSIPATPTVKADVKKVVNNGDEDDPSLIPLKKLFLTLCLHCRTVICCRVAPKQKASVVGLVRHYLPSAVTLSIGDGANDVAMIQEAHIGVGISGQEGLQAARAADYSFAQFRFLARLLLVHGRYNYRRISKLILYSFYKNAIVQLIQFWYFFFNRCSGKSIYENTAYSMFNVLWAAFPIMVLAVLDIDVEPAVSMAFPQLYVLGQKNHYLNPLLFLEWMFNAALQSLIIFFVPFFALHGAGLTNLLNTNAIGDGTSNYLGLHNGKTADDDMYGFIIFTAVILVVNIKIGFETSSWTYIPMTGLLLTIFAWIVFCVIWSSALYFVDLFVPVTYISSLNWGFFNFIPQFALSTIEGVRGMFHNFYFVSFDAIFSLDGLAVLILIVVICALKDLTSKAFVRLFGTQLYHIIQQQSSDPKYIQKVFHKHISKLELGKQRKVEDSLFRKIICRVICCQDHEEKRENRLGKEEIEEMKKFERSLKEEENKTNVPLSAQAPASANSPAEVPKPRIVEDSSPSSEKSDVPKTPKSPVRLENIQLSAGVPKIEQTHIEFEDDGYNEEVDDEQAKAYTDLDQYNQSKLKPRDSFIKLKDSAFATGYSFSENEAHNEEEEGEDGGDNQQEVHPAYQIPENQEDMI